MKKMLSLFLSGLLLGAAPVGLALAQDKTFTNTMGMEFVLIPDGKFTIAWTEEEVSKQKVVTISKPFYLGKYEVTQEQWVAVMGTGINPSNNQGRTNPVEHVSWNDVQEFVKKLNEKEGVKQYRLPTEAEWEHAARAGTDTEYFFGNDPAALGEYAWFSQNSNDTTHPVGEKKPNPWGLYDIYGNVWEWVQDWYSREDWFQEGAVTDPAGPERGSHRVIRGGSWSYGAEDCRSADRYYNAPDDRYHDLGFRLAFSPGQ